MSKYIIKRMLQLIPISLVLTFLTFALMYLAPGDPAEMKLKAQGIVPSMELLETTRENMGLNKPFLQQYGEWLWNLLHGDFGTSYKDGQPVFTQLCKATRYTVVLASSAIIVSLLISFPLGLLTALHKNRFSDYLIRFLTFIGNSVPNFFIALLLIFFLCLKFKVLPVIAANSIRGLILPTLAMSSHMSCSFIRQFRAEILEQLGSDYVVGERARGDLEMVILIKNVLHNSMITILTVVGLYAAVLMCGSVIIETIFMWPGLGKLVMDSISNRDYPIIQGFVLWMSMIYLIVNLLTDISYRWFDPRIKDI